MPYPHIYNGLAAIRWSELERPIPNFKATVIQYSLNEGQSANLASMNNIVFDSRTPADFGPNLVTNGDFDGTYVAGVAPDWSVDAGVTASEGVSPLGAQIQIVTNMNGVSQGLQGTGLTGLTVGGIYVVDLQVVRRSGTGNLQIQFNGFNGMAGTYDISSANLAASTVTEIKFYLVANSTTSTITITADTTALDMEIYSCSLKNITGGNHLVMDFNLYDRANRDSNTYDFNGVDQYFYIEDSRHKALDISGKFSMAFILKADSIAGGHMIGKWKNLDYAYLAQIAGAQGFLRTYVSANGSTIQNFRGSTGTGTMPHTSYHFMGTSYDTPNGLGRMNTDGVEDTVVYSTGPPLTITSLSNNSYRFAMGCSFDLSNVPSNFYNGKLGKVIVWSGVYLTQKQLIQAFNLLRTEYGI